MNCWTQFIILVFESNGLFDAVQRLLDTILFIIVDQIHSMQCDDHDR